jgi:hypothetical protein
MLLNSAPQFIAGFFIPFKSAKSTHQSKLFSPVIIPDCFLSGCGGVNNNCQNQRSFFCLDSIVPAKNNSGTLETANGKKQI